MAQSLRKVLPLFAVAMVSALGLLPMSAHADPSFYQTPIFGISNAPGGRLLVADAGQGVVDGDTGALISALPGVTDVTPRRGGGLWASVSAEEQGTAKLYRIKHSG